MPCLFALSLYKQCFGSGPCQWTLLDLACRFIGYKYMPTKIQPYKFNSETKRNYLSIKKARKIILCSRYYTTVL